MDLELTRFGKNLLSRGAFKPVYYQFFDDDIIYSIERLGTVEDQNDSETRIKDGVRLRTQTTVTGLETSFDEQKSLIASGTRGTFLQLKRQADPLERDKLLKYPLANYKISSQRAPNFVLKSLGSDITGSVKYIHPSSSGIYKNRPEITLRPKQEYIIDRRNIVPPEDIVHDAERFIDLTQDKVEFLDGSKIEITRESFIIDLEEFATSYGLDNFEMEIYEETEPGSEQYAIMQSEADIFSLVNVETDRTVREVQIKESKSNFYSD